MIIDGATFCSHSGFEECLDCLPPDTIDLAECADCHGPADHVYMLDDLTGPVGLCRTCDPDGVVVEATLSLLRAGVRMEVRA